MGVNALIFTDCTSVTFSRSAGAYKIASQLRKNGYTVQVVDYFLYLGLDRTLKIIEKFVDSSTLIVGFSTTFMNLNHQYLKDDNDKKFKADNITLTNNHISGVSANANGVPITDDDMKSIAEKIKIISPKAKIVIGGTKADYLSQKHVDTFILGYADDSIIDYMKYLEGKNPFFQFKSLNRQQILVDYDVDATKHDFQNSVINYHKSDIIEPNEVLPIEISRGCIFKCKFCAYRFTGKNKFDHLKSGDILYDEFMRNYDNFGVTKYIFADDTYNETTFKVEQFYKVTQKLPFKLEFGAYLRHDLIHRFPEQADLLLASGLKSALFGIETLNYQAGKSIGKGLHPEKTIELLNWLKYDKGWDKKILMSSGFIVGLPYENIDTVRKWSSQLMSKDFPLDSFIFQALSIVPDARRLGKSEFELNYEKYGYYFDKSKSSGWINEHWNRDIVNMYANGLSSSSHFSGRVLAFGFIGMMLHNYGYTWDQIFSTPAHILFKNIIKKTYVLADNYYEKLMNYEI